MFCFNCLEKLGHERFNENSGAEKYFVVFTDLKILQLRKTYQTLKGLIKEV